MTPVGRVDLEPINGEIRALLWRFMAPDHWPSALPRAFPMQYPAQCREGLLTVGLNGSFDARRDTVLSVQQRDELCDDQRATAVLEWERRQLGWVKGIRPYRHYQPLRAIAAAAGLPWAHLDLFAVRGKDAQIIDKLTKSRDHARWFQEQLTLFDQASCMLRPRVILVESVTAADLFQRRYHLTKAREDLFYRWRSADAALVDVPVFLTGMMTRGVDRHTLERWGVLVRMAARDGLTS